MDLDPSAYYTKEFEALEIGLQVAIAPYLSGASVEIRQDAFIDDIVCRVRGYVWSEQLERIVIEYPADWWQAFKKRWFPSWAIARWPAKHTRHVLDVKAKYPEFSPQPPNLGAARLTVLSHKESFLMDRR